MPREITDLDVEKNRIVRELFVDTADDNYITARWCYARLLNIDFHWLAVHALEKYLKAILLLNGHSSKNYKHDVVKLYVEVHKFAADLLPKNLDKPDLLSLPGWYVETPKAYLRRLMRYGNADNRYMLFGYTMHFEDIYKLDRMVFCVRRLCCFLDAYYLREHIRQEIERMNPSRDCNFSFRDHLLRQPKSWERIGGRLEQAMEGQRDAELQKVILNHNLPFAPAGYEHGEMQIRTSSHTPVLWRAIIDPLTRDFSEDAKQLAGEACEWAIENIQLPTEAAGQLREVKARAGGNGVKLP